MKIIFNADDYGYSKGINFGVIDAYENGLVRSATMMANMPGFEHGVALWKASPGLKIGVHLVLTTGASLGGIYKTITDSTGQFLNQSIIIKRAHASELDLSEIEKEYMLQIEKILAAGISITHFDGHHHIHCLPGIIDVFMKLAKKYQVAVRVCDRTSVDCTGIKAPAFNDTFHAEAATVSQIEHILSACTEDTEIMCHPAYLDSFIYSNTSYNVQRVKELEVLTDPYAISLIEKYGHTLSSYADL